MYLPGHEEQSVVVVAILPCRNEEEDNPVVEDDMNLLNSYCYKDRVLVQALPYNYDQLVVVILTPVHGAEPILQ